MNKDISITCAAAGFVIGLWVCLLIVNHFKSFEDTELIESGAAKYNQYTGDIELIQHNK